MPHGDDMPGAEYRTNEDIFYFGLLGNQANMVNGSFPSSNVDCCWGYAQSLAKKFDSNPCPTKILELTLELILRKC